MKIRAARPEDAKEATRIVFESLRSFGIEPEPEGMDRDVLSFGSRPASDGADEIVLEIDGSVAGLACLEPHEDGGWISKVFVDARHRGVGAGRALMEHAILRARERGYAKVGLRTRTIFESAVRLYERLGFARGPDPEMPNGGPDRTYWLALR